MIRVVLDTNVIVSALISPFGNESLVLHAVQYGKITPCLSRKITEEYKGVLARPKFSFAPDEIDGLIGLLQAKGLLFEPPPAPDAAFLVTGNIIHFPAHSCGQTRVVSARELLDYISTQQSR